jgi:hypothetical protein
MQLYHNVNASDVDSFSTHSDGTKGQLQRKGKGNCQAKNYNIGDTSMAIVGSGPFKGTHLGTHLSTHTDIQCLRRSG